MDAGWILFTFKQPFTTACAILPSAEPARWMRGNIKKPTVCLLGVTEKTSYIFLSRIALNKAKTYNQTNNMTAKQSLPEPRIWYGTVLPTEPFFWHFTSVFVCQSSVNQPTVKVIHLFFLMCLRMWQGRNMTCLFYCHMIIQNLCTKWSKIKIKKQLYKRKMISFSLIWVKKFMTKRFKSLCLLHCEILTLNLFAFTIRLLKINIFKCWCHK